MRRAQKFDPLTPLWPAWQGWQHWDARQYDEAIREAQKSLELSADFPVGLYVLGSAYASTGMYEEAIFTHEQLNAVSSDWPFALVLSYAVAGRTDEARQKLAKLEADAVKWDVLPGSDPCHARRRGGGTALAGGSLRGAEPSVRAVDEPAPAVRTAARRTAISGAAAEDEAAKRAEQ